MLPGALSRHIVLFGSVELVPQVHLPPRINGKYFSSMYCFNEFKPLSLWISIYEYREVKNKTLR